MRNIILASVAAIALLGVAACSDTDNTTTQSVDQPPATTEQPAPQTGTGGAMQGSEPTQPKPVQPDASGQ